MLDSAITCLIEEDRKHAAETGELLFMRAAKALEIELFKKMVAGLPIPGGGPRTLYLIVAKNARAFVSAPRDIVLPKYTEDDLSYLLACAQANGVASIVVIDLLRKN